MSKCVKCGNEILTGDIHWEMGLCNNCHNKLYYEQELADIDYKWFGIKRNKTKDEQISDLEANLAERESKAYTLESYNNFLNNQCKKLIKENKQLIKALNGEVFINYKVPMENAQLKQQLEEKEKEIEDAEKCAIDYQNENTRLEQEVNHLKSLLDLEVAYRNKLLKQDQDKISFAVEQLEKVKEFCDGIKLSMIYISQEDTTKIQTIIEEIDNQIKQLKEGK